MTKEPKIRVLLNLHRGKEDERPISNEEQIQSFGSYGAWLRVLTAYRLIRDYRGTGGATVSNVSTIVGLYEQLGMFFEDVACTAAAWGASTLDRSVRIADVLERTVITTRPVTTSSCYHDSVFRDLATSGKRLQVNANQLLRSLSELRNDELLRKLGVDWKKVPSVKLVSKEKRREWSQLPMVAAHLFNTFQSPNAHLLSSNYNKLKHGPQFIIMSSLEAARRRGQAASKKEEELMMHAFVRILHQGSRTQEHEGELETGKRVAPFLVGDQQTLSGWVFETMLFTAINMFLLADWKYRRATGEHLRLPKDGLVERMLQEKEERWVRAMGMEHISIAHRW